MPIDKHKTTEMDRLHAQGLAIILKYVLYPNAMSISWEQHERKKCRELKD